MPLVVHPEDLRTLASHAERLYPEECCGVLLGEKVGGNTVVRQLLATANERPDHRRHRYFIAAETVLAAHRGARAQGLRIVGFYHSHPDAAGRPGEFDRQNAWTGVSYLIVPVAHGVAGPAASWRLRDDARGFDPEPLQAATSHGENERG